MQETIASSSPILPDGRPLPDEIGCALLWKFLWGRPKGRTLLRHELAKATARAVDDGALDAELGKLLSRQMVEETANPWPDFVPPDRQLGLSDDPLPRERCYKLTPLGAKAVHALMVLRYNLTRPWLLGPDRISAQVLIAVTMEPIEVARIDAACVDASTAAVSAAVHDLVDAGLLRETQDHRYALTVAGEARKTEAEREIAVLRSAIAPPIGKGLEVMEYDVALSFAGEDRKHAEALAAALSQRGVRVFYDAYEQANLWGKDLYQHLSDVYQRRARYCVVFISANYARKLWTNHELKSAQARAFGERREYILPLRLDDTDVAGILPTVSYLRVSERSTESIADAILVKLASQPPPVPSVQATPAVSRCEMVLDVQDPAAAVPVPRAVQLVRAELAKSPRREVCVVPAAGSGELLDPRSIVQVERACRVADFHGTRFPRVPDEVEPLRRASGLLWKVEEPLRRSCRFALGFDGSFAYSEQMYEIVGPHPHWGTGVGLFSCLDGVIGALFFARRLAVARPALQRARLVLSMEEIEGQRLVLNFDEVEAHKTPQGDHVCRDSTVRVGVDFDPRMDDSDIESCAAEIGAALSYYFGWTWNDRLTNAEVHQMVVDMANASR